MPPRSRPPTTSVPAPPPPAGGSPGRRAGAAGQQLVSGLALCALPPMAVALAMLLGAGVIRQGPPLLVSLAAAMLVTLPAMGIGALFRRRMLGFTLGLLLWPTAVVVGFPLYFPGERAEALASGATVLLLPFGLSLSPDHARTVDALLPGPQPVRPIPPRADVLEVAPPPPSPVVPGIAEEDQVVLPYEGEDHTMAVPVGLQGARSEVLERWLLFDTGASLTTLNRATLAALGVEVRTDAPEVTVRTAAGERRTRLALLERAWIGGMEVDGVTVSVCDACADDTTVGLLGLNITGRFLVTVDSVRQELVLQPRDAYVDRVVDVAPWLDIEATATRWQDGRIEVEVRAENRAPRTIAAAQVGIRCDDTWVAELRDIPPYGRARTTVGLPMGADCDGYSVALEGARW